MCWLLLWIDSCNANPEQQIRSIGQQSSLAFEWPCTDLIEMCVFILIYCCRLTLFSYISMHRRNLSVKRYLLNHMRLINANSGTGRQMINNVEVGLC